MSAPLVGVGLGSSEQVLGRELASPHEGQDRIRGEEHGAHPPVAVR